MKRVLITGANSYLGDNTKVYLEKNGAFHVDIVDNYIENNDRKSIEFDYIKTKGIKISESYLPRLKYLDAVDIAFFKETV